MKKLALVMGLILFVVGLSGCATQPVSQPRDDDNGRAQTAPAKAPRHHIDYKGESLDK